MTHEEILAKLDTNISLRGMSDDNVKEYITKAQVFMRHFNKLADEIGEKEFHVFLKISR